MQRHGWAIRLKPDKLEEYKKYHAEIWPEIATMIKACHIRNYSIYHRDGFLFSYLEYTGNDFDADMVKMAEDPKTLEWWDIMKPMQEPLESATKDEWWGVMEEVFHLE